MPTLITQGPPGAAQGAPGATAPRAAAPQGSFKTLPTADYGSLKAREHELKNQLEDVQDRRNDLAQQAEQSSGSTRSGLQSRIDGLDQRLVQIETDLGTVGRELAATAPVSIVTPPPRIINQGYNDDDMVGAGFAGAGLMLALFVPFLIRSFRRKRRADVTTPQPFIGGERIERMEQAIDTIAVEMERVSENQRFMTRLLTETQLAGTIAAVRGSAEAAKAAAEGSNVR